MGVTIHFEGQLSKPENFDQVILTAKTFAEDNNLDYFLFQEDNKRLSRVRDEQDWDYVGPTKGIQLQPDENSEPFILEFDKDSYLQEYCKTQFADISVHILVIDLLRQIEPFFHHLTVTDEGEYWDTSDITILQQLLDDCFQAMDETKKEDATLTGPFKLENGRIADLIQTK